jgi:Orsellinic acid/F9775 biosynthesis cluster protein D
MDRVIKASVYYNIQHRLAICRLCGTVLPATLDGHFRQQHPAFTSKERRAISDAVKEWDTVLPETFHNEMIFVEKIVAIDGLPIHDVLQCNDCGMIGSESTIIKHCRADGWREGQGISFSKQALIEEPVWKHVKAQTLQENKNRRYFLVTTDDEQVQLPIDKDLVIQQTLTLSSEQDEAYHLSRHRVEVDDNTKDTPWLARTGWKRMFDGQDMQKLSCMTSLKLDDSEGWLEGVEKLVGKMVEKAYMGIFLFQ